MKKQNNLRDDKKNKKDVLNWVNISVGKEEKTGKKSPLTVTKQIVTSAALKKNHEVHEEFTDFHNYDLKRYIFERFFNVDFFEDVNKFTPIVVLISKILMKKKYEKIQELIMDKGFNDVFITLCYLTDIKLNGTQTVYVFVRKIQKFYTSFVPFDNTKNIVYLDGNIKNISETLKDELDNGGEVLMDELLDDLDVL